MHVNELDNYENNYNHEYNFLYRLYSKDTVPITPAEVCYYALALTASCDDPHNFHGHNLIGKLKKTFPIFLPITSNRLP